MGPRLGTSLAELMHRYNVKITPETLIDIKTRGLSAPPGLDVADMVDPTATLLCLPFTPGEMLLLPDNLIGECVDCRRAIQFRPHAAPIKNKRCMSCLTAQR